MTFSTLNQVVIQHFSLPLGPGSVSKDKVRTPEQVDAAIRAAYPPSPPSSAPHAPAPPSTAPHAPAATATTTAPHAPGVDDPSEGEPRLKTARTGGAGGGAGIDAAPRLSPENGQATPARTTEDLLDLVSHRQADLGGGAGATVGAEAGGANPETVGGSGGGGGGGDGGAGGGGRLRLVKASERSSKALKRGQVSPGLPALSQ